MSETPASSNLPAMRHELDQERRSDSYLSGGNAPYLEKLYAAYLSNPGSVPDNWRSYFDAMQHAPAVDGSNLPDVDHSSVIASFAERVLATSELPLNTVLHDLEDMVVSGEFALEFPAAPPNSYMPACRPWPHEKRSEPYEL
jgi:hypothetical protein